MTPRHHLDDATLLSYASGALSESLAVVAATHLSVCLHCRERLRTADAVGGVLMMRQQLPDETVDAQHMQALRAELLRRLDAPDAPDDTSSDVSARHTLDTPSTLDNGDAAANARPQNDPGMLPATLHRYFGPRYNQLRWRWLGPGIRCIRARTDGPDNLIMLKIAPGRSLPMHRHGRSELTQILQGAYNDALGHFAPGDMADLDNDVCHQPITCPGVPCVCVAALDAPLEFSGWLARKLQRLSDL